MNKKNLSYTPAQKSALQERSNTQENNQEKIHIAYIITKLELGGAQKVCLTLFEGLAQANAETLLISGDQGPLVEQVRNKSNVFLLSALKRELSFRALFYELRAFWLLIQQLRTLKKKYPKLIVHTHSTKAGLLGRWAAFFAGIKKRVHTIHGYAFHAHQSKITWLLIYLPELFTSFITTHFVCVSTADVKTGKKLFPRFGKKNSIIRAAVDWHQFYTPATRTDSMDTVPTDTDSFIFGTVSCFKPQKNLFDLLSAFAWVYSQNKKVRLELIGDGVQRSAIEKWIAHHQLSSVITLHGWQEKVAPLMRHWHAFVLSSLWEGLPCAVIEARLLKLPVISYTTGGIPDVIVHGKNGLLCAQKDWHTLAWHMLELSRNIQTYKRMREQKESFAEFKDAHMIAEHKKLYLQLAKQ